MLTLVARDDVYGKNFFAGLPGCVVESTYKVAST